MTRERSNVLNKIAGERLKECIDMRGYRSADVIRLAKKKYGIEIPRQNISNYIHGTSISNKKILILSDILNVDEGYISCCDGGISDNYISFLSLMEKKYGRIKESRN